MVPGMVIRSFSGREGEIFIPGLGAVVGTFHQWTLRRPEENATGNPRWTLQAVLSYSNQTLLLNDMLEKRFTLVLNKTRKIELCGYESMKLEGNSLLLEGVIQCQ
jgi:hypothetical protein